MPSTFRLVLVLILVCCARWSAAAVQDLTYFLDPGSTITPLSGSVEIGPIEFLTGYFVWHPRNSGFTNGQGFDATALAFKSPSFTLTLDTTSANDEFSNTFSDGRTYFAEVVDATGLSANQLEMGGVVTPGSFVGDYHQPTHVSYDVLLYPRGGGSYRARTTFSATLPEPLTGTVPWCFAAAALIRRRRLICR